MKRRLSFAILIGLLSITLPSFAQEKHADISLRGPWILYVDSSKTFADRPLLIAMAPAIDHDPNNHWAHQPPTVSNGTAYQLGDPTKPYPPTDSQIYCLTFDDKCAPNGASSLDPDGYPAPNPVPARVPTDQKNWNWVTASRQYYATTLILPVPDSYGADTAWPMRFAPTFKVDGTGYDHIDTYSTGVVLRYAKGPAWFDLKICPKGKPANISSCTDSTGTKHTHLANNGPLHIEMKAPDTNWSCDPHVRRVYPQMRNLFGAPPSPYAVIDPAHDLYDNGSGVYDMYEPNHTFPDPNHLDPNTPYPSTNCLEHDNQGGYKDERYPPSSHSKDGTNDTTRCSGASANVDPWIGCVQQLVKNIPDDRQLESLSENARKALREIKTDGSDSELRFPWLAQLRRLDDNIAFLGRLKDEVDAKKAPADQSLPPFLHTILPLLTQLQKTIDPYTKTHGDCGAPVILLTDN